MKIRRPDRVASQIPTASMADIAFLLIVFFMVTTQIAVDRTALGLPTSFDPREVPPDAAMIVIEASGVLHFSNGQEQSHVINPGDLLAAAAILVQQEAAKVFVIKADGEARYEMIDAVLEQLQLARVAKIALLTEAEEIE